MSWRRWRCNAGMRPRPPASSHRRTSLRAQIGAAVPAAERSWIATGQSRQHSWRLGRPTTWRALTAGLISS